MEEVEERGGMVYSGVGVAALLWAAKAVPRALHRQRRASERAEPDPPVPWYPSPSLAALCTTLGQNVHCHLQCLASHTTACIHPLQLPCQPENGRPDAALSPSIN